jgi:replicative DNA helicase
VTQDRPFPHDIAAERSLLGGLLTQPEALLRVEATLCASDFHRPEHGLLFELLREMQRTEQGIDIVTVSERILRAGKADRYGGAAYVAELPEHCPSTANLGHYAGIVRNKAALRAMIATARDLEARGFDEQADPVETLDLAAEQLRSLAGEHRRAEHEGTLGEAAERDIERRSRMLENRQMPTVETKLWSLDQILNGGLRRGDLVVIAAESSMGKTALATSITCGLGAHGHGVGSVILEGSEEEFVHRTLANVSRLPLGKFRNPVRREHDGSFSSSMTPDEEEHVAGWTEALHAWPVRFWSRPGATWANISAQIRRWSMVLPLRLAIVDYVQLLFAERGQREASNEASLRIASQAKALAEQLGITVALLSQVTTRGEKGAAPVGRRKLVDGPPWWDQVDLPRKNQLRGGDDLGNAADIILFPVRATQLGLPLEPSEAVIKVEKNRHGRTGVVPVLFDPKCAAYRSDTGMIP